MQGHQVDVLLVEDDEDDHYITRRLLERVRGSSYDLHWEQDFDAGLASVLGGKHDVALVDYRLGRKSGLDLIQEARRQGARTPIILLTGQGDLETDRRAMSAGAFDYLVKGEISSEMMERSIRYALGRREAEDRIRAQGALLDKASDAICCLEIGGGVIYWNRSAEALTGQSAETVRDLEGDELMRRIYDVSEEHLEEIRRQVLGEGEWHGELHMQAPDGETRVVENRWSLVRDDAGRPEAILVVGTDVTERRMLESQFLRAQRMESIGRMAGGIAHDLGNLLVPVLLGVEVLRNHVRADERTTRTLKMIEKSAQRGRDMVRNVLSLARGIEGERTVIALPEVLEEVERLTDMFPSDIDVRWQVSEDLHEVLGDATQVQQVIMNLCVNARDAMPEGGHLRIEVANVAVSEHEAARSMDATAGDFVRVRVSDDGTGISPEIQDKVFEPFFTTKSHGEGTGLGLSTVYSIVKSHGGFVQLESRPGRGTTFDVYWPLAPDDVEVTAPAVPLQGGEGKGELVLVVDDEPLVVRAACEALERGRYQVVAATSSLEGWQLFQEHQDTVAAVVTDLLMPGMPGTELIRRIREMQSNIPILAVSSPSDGQREEALQAGADHMVAKPYAGNTLRAALHHLLAQRVSDEDAPSSHPS